MECGLVFEEVEDSEQRRVLSLQPRACWNIGVQRLRWGYIGMSIGLLIRAVMAQDFGLYNTACNECNLTAQKIFEFDWHTPRGATCCGSRKPNRPRIRNLRNLNDSHLSFSDPHTSVMGILSGEF